MVHSRWSTCPLSAPTLTPSTALGSVAGVSDQRATTQEVRRPFHAAMLAVGHLGLVLTLTAGCGTQPHTDPKPNSDAPHRTPTTPEQPAAAPGVVGVVDNGYPLLGSPPGFEPWPSVAGLDGTFDVAPVVLTKPIPDEVRLLVVPLLNALDQPRLDALGAAIDSGIPAIIIADPFALKWLEPDNPSGWGSSADMVRMRAHNIGSEGDAMGLLRDYGVDWDDQSVLEQDRQPERFRLVDVVQVSPVGPGGAGLRDVAAIYPGRLEATAGDFEPLLVASRRVVSRPAAFNNTSGGVEFDDRGRAVPLAGPVVFAARTSGEGRGDVTVIADQDVFADPSQSEQASEMLVRLAAPYVEPFRPAAVGIGAPLLPVDPLEVASIELVERSPGSDVEAVKNADTDPYASVFAGDARRARAFAHREGRWGIQRFLRLERVTQGWALDTGRVRRVEFPEPISRLLRAFARAKLKEAPAPKAQSQESKEGAKQDPPATLRVVMRDAQGRRLADAVLETASDGLTNVRIRGSDQRFVVSLAFESDLKAFEKELEPSLWKDSERGIDLGDFGLIGN